MTVMHGRDPDRLRAVAAVDPTIRLAASEAQFAELRPYYDVVFIGSPPFLHLPHLELAFRLGTPVICEKPLTARRADYPRLAGLLGAGGLPFALAHQVRHQQAVAELSRLISCGDLGAPVAADLHWCFLMNHAASNARWKLDPTLGGSNAMFDCGVHAIDLALLLFGMPTRAGATAHRINGAAVQDAVTVVLDYPGLAVTIVASQAAAAAGNDVRIVFERGTAHARGLLGERAAPAVEVVGAKAQSAGHVKKIACADDDLYRREVEDFCRSLNGSAPGLGTSAAEALDAARILFAIEDSIASGRFVELGGYCPQ